MTWGLEPAADHITQREAVRAYVLAGNVMQDRAMQALSDGDWKRWEYLDWLAQRIHRAAEIEEREPAGWSVT